MKKLLFALLALLAALTAAAINPDKHLVYHSSGDHTIVFVKPRKMSKAPGCPAVKPLTYDITMNTMNDSVLVTFTLTTREPAQTSDSTTVNNRFTFANSRRNYIEPKGKNWENRLGFYMSQSQFSQTFCNPDSGLTLNIDGNKFEISPKNRKKDAEICRTALQIIELNRK